MIRNLTTTKMKLNNELIFVLYLIGFQMLKILSTLTVKNGFIINIIWIIMLALISFFLNFKKNIDIIKTKKYIIFILLILSHFCFDYIFRYNIVQNEYFINFIIYGAIPLYFLKKVNDYDKVLKYYVVLSILKGSIYIFDPFIGYKYSGNYMGYGFNYALPMFLSFVTMYIYYKNKKYLVFIFLSGINLLIYSNKSSFITGILFLLFLLIMKNKNKIMLILYTTILSFSLYIYIDTIKLYIIKFLNKFVDKSYAARSFIIFLNGEEVSHSRKVMYRNAYEIFKQDPIIGSGIGICESYFGEGRYAHNIVLEILSSSGVIVFIIYIVTLLLGILSIIRMKVKSKQFFTLMMFFSCFIPLQFSGTYWTTISFWVFYGICLYNFKIKRMRYA